MNKTKDEIRKILINRLPPSVPIDECEVLAGSLETLSWIEGQKLTEILKDDIFPK